MPSINRTILSLNTDAQWFDYDDDSQGFLPGESDFDMAFGFSKGLDPSVGSLKVQYHSITRDENNELLPNNVTEIKTIDCGSKINGWVKD